MSLANYPEGSGFIYDSNGNLINPATSDNQTNGSQKSQLVDGNGDPIFSAGEGLATYLRSEEDTGSAAPDEAIQIAGQDPTGVLRPAGMFPACQGAYALNTNAIPARVVNAINGSLFGVSDETTLSSGAESEAFLIRNPASSGKTIVLCDCSVDIISQLDSGVFRFYVEPTVTALGTTITPINFKRNGPVPSPVATVHDQPTVSAAGNRVLSVRSGNTGSFSIGGGGSIKIDGLVGLVLDEGEDMLMTYDGDGSGHTVAINFQWGEVVLT